MKHNAIFALLLIISLLPGRNIFGQASDCRGLVVWNFAAEDDNKSLARRVTDEVEEILTEIPACRVLERRKFSDLYRVIENEKAIQSLTDASRDAKTALIIADAQLVMFGTVKSDHDFIGGIRIQLKVENLTTTSVVHANSIILDGEQAAPRNRKENLRCFVYQLMEVPLPTNCIPKKDMGWDSAIQVNTRTAYESYLEHCSSPCQHAAEAHKIIADERAWDAIRSTSRNKDLIAKLSRYASDNYSRHENQAHALLANVLTIEEKRAKREWMIAAAALLVSAGAITGSVVLENKASAKYRFYAENRDPGDLSVYADYEARERMYTDANQQHKSAQWLKVGGICAGVTAAWFLGKRISWHKTLQTGNNVVLAPEILTASGSIAATGVLFRLCF